MTDQRDATTHDSLQFHPDIADIVTHTQLDWPSTFDSIDDDGLNVFADFSAPPSTLPSPRLLPTSTDDPSRPTTSSTSSSSTIPHLDLHCLEYPTPPHESLICTICFTAFVDPVQLPCEHTFCRGCLDFHFDNAHSDSKTCPKCRGTLDVKTGLKPSPRIVKQMLDELVVKCPSLGCTKEMPRYMVTDHVERYCEFAEIECPHPECQARRNPDEPISRYRDCFHDLERCAHCSEVVLKENLQRHLDACPMASQQCPFCHITMPHSALLNHEENECLSREIPCPGSGLSCPYKAIRHDTNIHAQTCTLALISNRLALETTARETETASLREQLATQSQKIHRYERLQAKMNSIEATLERVTTHLFDEDGRPRAPPFSSSSAYNSWLSSATVLTTPTTSTSTNPLSDPSTFTTAGSLHYIQSTLEEHLTRQDDINAIHFTRIEELDAHTNMILLNETQRWQTEMLALGAAVTSMRGEMRHLVSRSFRPAALAVNRQSVVEEGTGANWGDLLSPTSLGGGMGMPAFGRRTSANSVPGDNPKL